MGETLTYPVALFLSTSNGRRMFKFSHNRKDFSSFPSSPGKQKGSRSRIAERNHPERISYIPSKDEAARYPNINWHNLDMHGDDNSKLIIQ
jgi:hypothetical protein